MTDAHDSEMTMAEPNRARLTETDQRVADLRQIIDAYNQVTEKLQKSHDTLTDQVVRLQQELASANSELQRSKRLAALGEMAAGIAHEIRNPLASIQLYVRMLEEDLVRMPAQLEITRKVAQAVRGLNGIVTDVLTFARELKIVPAPVTAGALFARAVEAIGPMVQQKQLQVTVAGDDDESMVLRCDRELMHQVLLNLVRNAAEAVESGGRIRLTAARESGDRIRLQIADDGPGIDEQVIDRIFNPFFTTRNTGTGLGLAIVHRIVDAHGGTISVDHDGGAVFTLIMPETAIPRKPQGTVFDPKAAEQPTES